jgi:urease accessory protein
MITRNRILTLVSLCAAALVPSIAMAHPGHGVGQDLIAGVMHPLSGLDHVLMIVAVSAWASSMSGARRLIVAACLAVFVAIGAMVPAAPLSGASLEAAIALTVIGSGMLLALGRGAPIWLAGSLAAAFALVHGFAHGAEGSSALLAYVTGLAAATGGLALVVSFIAARLQAHRGWLRLAGALGAGAGAAALFTA